jgi:hypothetical protein
MMKTATVAFAAFFLLIGHGLRGDPASEQAQALQGCWRGVGKDEASLVRFNLKTCLLFDMGKLQVFQARYEPGRLILRSLGYQVIWQITQKDGALALALPDGSKQVSFRKIEGVPPELELKALDFGQMKDVPAERLKEIQQDLAKRLKIDQEVRLDKTKADMMPQVDADNTAYLIGLVRQVGWIDVARFGKEASGAAFLIAQHSGHLPLMLAALPAVQKDFQAQRTDGQHYAAMYDRLELLLGRKQRFGTQIGQNEKGEFLVLSLQDRSKVEDYRKELGMTTLAQYLAFFKQVNGIKEIKFEEDD